MDIIFPRILHSKFSQKSQTQLTRSAAPPSASEDGEKKHRSGSILVV
jgi:hypothetical protein